MNYKVLDLFSTILLFSTKLSEYSEYKLIDKKMLDPLFVYIKDNKDNKRSFAMNARNLIFDDIISLDSKRQPFFDYSKIFHISKILAGLQYQINNLAEAHAFSVGALDNTDSTTYKEYLAQWYESELKLNKQQFLSDGVFATNIIPIPDNYSPESQDLILKALGGSRQTKLVWRSIAAFIALENQIKNNPYIKNNDIVTVIDNNNLGCIVTELVVYRENGRVIPGKKDSNSYTKEKRYTGVGENSSLPQFYQKLIIKSDLNYSKFYSGIYNGEDVIQIDLRNEEFTKSVRYKPQLPVIHYYPNEKVKMIISIGKEPSIDIIDNNQNIVLCNNESLIEGATKFVQRIEKQEIAYYEECQQLNMVVQTTQEEIHINEIVPRNGKIPGGIRKDFKPIEGLSILTSNKTINFYILLATEDRTVQLKKLEQNLSFSFDHLDSVEKLPIIVKPYFIPGQGQPKFVVEPKEQIQGVEFNPIEIDWANINDAFTEPGIIYSDSLGSKYKTLKPFPITVEFLEDTIERSFPVDIPPVECNKTSFLGLRNKIHNALFGNDNSTIFYEIATLNSSRWPNKDSFGMQRFLRTNIFGSVKSKNEGYPKNPEDKELSITFFKYLNERALSCQNDNDYLKYLTKIAWTYHGEFFKEILERTLNDVYTAGLNQKSVSSQKLTLCVNLISHDNEKLIILFIAFMNRIKNSDSLSNWLRIGYQLFMYNTSFLEKIKKKNLHDCVESLIYDYPHVPWPNAANDIMKILLFMLKYRRYDSTFLRSKETDESDTDSILYSRIKQEIITPSLEYLNTERWAKILEDYLDGKGSLDIPLEEDK